MTATLSWTTTFLIRIGVVAVPVIVCARLVAEAVGDEEMTLPPSEDIGDKDPAAARLFTSRGRLSVTGSIVLVLASGRNYPHDSN